MGPRIRQTKRWAHWAKREVQGWSW